MTDDVEQAVSVSREGCIARIYKARVFSLLEEVVGVMEGARKEGFVIDFSIPRNEAGENIFKTEFVKVTKSW